MVGQIQKKWCWNSLLNIVSWHMKSVRFGGEDMHRAGIILQCALEFVVFVLIILFN